MKWLLLFAAGASATSLRVKYDLRPDGVGVHQLSEEAVMGPLALKATDPPFKNFTDDYVQAALAAGKDWRTGGLVTPAKNQGGHPYCGTFARVGAWEGQYARLGGRGLRNFSEEELVECVGWSNDQGAYVEPNGFMDEVDYPYNMSGPSMNPPIPGEPCRYDAAKVIPGTANGNFTGSTGGRIADVGEEQAAAFVFHNGPVGTGVSSSVFYHLTPNCQKEGNCFITHEACDTVRGKAIDHAILVVGFGTDPTYGRYWLVKNSWSAGFANDGFVKVAWGYDDPLYHSCAGVMSGFSVPIYGSADKYYQ
eukprot:TRINITY_DN1231_c0_g1_i2.p1 TRINITY_DN1231_c0_g1~~TRINITY_DN1231_c0_g1_i2.p1  ORF type:complete len:307 (+),score=102.40 TRINITY_DN1231_c0_g1_i2:62-982(+)